MNWCGPCIIVCLLSSNRIDEEQWLDATRTPFVKAKSLLKPYPEELMDADVSPIVNSAKYDRRECIRPISNDEIPRAGQLSLL
jgi:putative SOS response-associated peptidase YedK